MVDRQAGVLNPGWSSNAKSGISQGSESKNRWHKWAFFQPKWKSLSHVRLFVTPWTIQSMEFSRAEYWSGWPFSSPGDLPNPGIELRFPALQADSLPAEPQWKSKNIGVGSLYLLPGSSWPWNWTQVSCIVGRFFTNWPTREYLLNVTE